MKKLKFMVLASLLVAACKSDSNFEDAKTLKADKNDSTALSDTATFIGDEVVLTKDTLDTKAFENVDASQEKIRTAGGVEIQFVSRGNGFTIEKGSVIRIKYQGKLPDGKVFDSSDLIGQALPFYVGIGMSVKGWDEALMKMRTGDKAIVKIPSKMAYGKSGYGKLIPPNTDLTFDMEIVELMEPEVTASGLQFYKTVEKPGLPPVEGNEVTIHYYGWLKDNGKLFDASHRTGKPYSYVLGKGKSIPAWNEALKMMNKGEKAILVVPAALGYGEIGVPELVPVNADLVYSIELINVK